jgi:hypothetical protein
MLTAAFILLIIGAALIAVVLWAEATEDVGGNMVMFAGLGLVVISAILFGIVNGDALESRFGDSYLLTDGGYYRIISVTQDPDDAKTHYVIYVPKQGVVRDVKVVSTNTNGIPTGMTKWSYIDKTFVSLSVEAQK